MHAGKLRFTMQVQDNVTCSFGQIMHNSNCARYLDDQPLCPDANNEGSDEEAKLVWMDKLL